MTGKKFLIGQLAYFGDCLYATTIAKQIKFDYPDSHITWAVATKYKSILNLNPYVDAIWEIENTDYYEEGWEIFESEAKKRLVSGEFNELIFSQIVPKWQNFDGTIRSSTFNAYPRPITVDVSPVLYLSDREIQNVKNFAEKHNLSNFQQVILFECSPGSGQSFVDLALAKSIAQNLTNTLKNICIILSGPQTLKQENRQIIDASELTFRENAELIKYCTLLIGCSSGITWLSTSACSKKINMLQLLNRDNVIYSGVKYDLKSWNIDTSNVIEITINNFDIIINCISSILSEGFQASKMLFDETYKPTYKNFKEVVSTILYTKGDKKLHRIIRTTILHAKRNKHLNIINLGYLTLTSFSGYNYLKAKLLSRRLFNRYINN